MTHIPTATVLTELRKEGFQPFMVTQTRVRDEGRREHTKHMIRLRHASQINGAEANDEMAKRLKTASREYIKSMENERDAQDRTIKALQEEVTRKAKLDRTVFAKMIKEDRERYAQKIGELQQRRNNPDAVQHEGGT